MNLETRILAFSLLGKELAKLTGPSFNSLAERASLQNPWFTPDNVRLALDGILKFLQKDALEEWVSHYKLETKNSKKIGVAMAGNIPMVGFHDFLCVLISGHEILIKPSSQDSILINFISDLLISIEGSFKSKIQIADRLNAADAFIATGSDNTARYFEYYFRNKPHIIRKNRSSIALLKGDESAAALELLGKDVFTYFGLGCRNVAKIYTPENYDFGKLLAAWEPHKEVILHHKYANNYDYQKAIHLVNQSPFYDNGFVLLVPSERLVSPISTVFYETYPQVSYLEQKLNEESGKLQCILSNQNWFPKSAAFGQSQLPSLKDYADGLDTLKFLESI